MERLRRKRVARCCIGGGTGEQHASEHASMGGALVSFRFGLPVVSLALASEPAGNDRNNGHRHASTRDPSFAGRSPRWEGGHMHETGENTLDENGRIQACVACVS